MLHRQSSLLVGVDDAGQVDLASLNGILENGRDPMLHVSVKSNICKWLETYSGGFAGSIMTASLDLSSTTRYA